MVNYKTIIAPFIALIVIILGMVGITLPDGLEGKITTALVDVITIIIVIYGIVHNHKDEIEKGE